MVFDEVDIEIADTEEVIVPSPDYVMELGRLLQKTSPRSVVDRCSLQFNHLVVVISLFACKYVSVFQRNFQDCITCFHFSFAERLILHLELKIMLR